MQRGVVDGFPEWLQLLHRVLGHHPPRRRELSVLDAVLFPLHVSEACLCLGLLLRLKELPPRLASFSEADVIPQIWPLRVTVLANFDLPPSPRVGDRRAAVFVCHISFCSCFKKGRICHPLVFLFTFKERLSREL
jgi:hypothetical protein